MSTTSLEAIGLTRRFGDLTAVDHVDFRVEPGTVIGLLGANGAGKTTTIRMLAGLLDPSAGRALLLGAPPGLDSQRRLGYVPQGLGLYADLTVRENLAFVAEVYQIRPVEPTGRLAAVADRLVRQIPLGLQRELAFDAAVQHAPEVLILDEPTSGVGPLGATGLWDRIRQQAEQGVGVLVSTHSMSEARQCDRLLLMSAGRLVGTGSEAELTAGMTTVAVSADPWDSAFRALAAEGTLVTLDGRSVRVSDRAAAEVERILAAAGVTAEVREVPATIAERMAALARQSRT